MKPKSRRRSAGRNDEVLAALRARRTRLLIWFLSFVLLMPLGCVGPCLVGAVVPNETAKTVFFVTAFLLPFVGLGGVLLMFNDRLKANRSLALAEEAEALDFDFTERPPPAAYSRLRGLRGVGGPDFDLGINRLSGEVDGEAISLLDYSLTFGYGRYSRSYSQTMVCLPDAAEDVPDFLLWPTGSFLTGLTDKVSRLFGKRVIELDDPEFGRQFALRGQDEDEVAACFTRDVVDLCLDRPDLAVEVRDGLLALYAPNRVARPAEYPDLVEHAGRWLKALRQRDGRR